MSDLLTIADLDAGALRAILDLSTRADLGRPLAGKGVGMVFQKPSARTRNSMELAVTQLGGHPVYIQKEEVGLGERETPEDVARTLACYHAIIAARVSDHSLLDRMAAAVETPLLNMLSDSDHPLQALADLLTIEQLAGPLEGLPIAYVGDANNVCRSLAQGCALLGARLTIASPEGYGLSPADLADLEGVAQVIDRPRRSPAHASFIPTSGCRWARMRRPKRGARRLPPIGWTRSCWKSLRMRGSFTAFPRGAGRK